MFYPSERHRTNITEPLGKYSSSRGQLVSSFLLPKTSAGILQDHLNGLAAGSVSYAGFNLLLLSSTASVDDESGEARFAFDAAYVTNSGGGGKNTFRSLTTAERRCGGLSNGIDGRGAEDWPKVKHGIQSFGDVLKSVDQDMTENTLIEQLFELLT